MFLTAVNKPFTFSHVQTVKIDRFFSYNKVLINTECTNTKIKHLPVLGGKL